LDVDALKTFLEVNRTRHFGQAAENLYLSQSAVSARIRMLEEEVGVPLFTRQRNNIQLTAAGERLLHYAESILTTWNRAKQQIGASEASQASLIIGLMPSLWDIVLHEWTCDMRRRHGNYMIQLELLEADVMVRRLVEGTLDLAFTFDPPASPQVRSREILQMPLIMVSSHPELELQRALQTDYVLVDWGSSFAAAHARQFPDIAAPMLRLPLGRMAKDLLLSLGGSAYLSEPMVRAELQQGRLFRVKNAPRIERQAYASYLATADKQKLLQQALAYFATAPDKTRRAI
jgi:DNA-binding transcriptional LysR family regulator